jgi:Mor family transcriptional regulator
LTFAPIELLPESIQDMAAIVGPALALRLLERFAGVSVRIPKRPRLEHPLTHALGWDDACTLSRAYGGELLAMPNGKAARLALRNEAIRAERRAGVSTAALARRFDLTERQIYSVIKAAR